MAGYSKLPIEGGLKKVGPAGKKEGRVWDQKGGHAITQILVSYEPCNTYSLQFQYVDEDGNLSMSQVFGNPDFQAPRFVAYTIDHPKQYISLVKGFYSDKGIEELTIIVSNEFFFTCGKSDSSESTEVKDDPRRTLFVYEFAGGSHEFGGFHGTCDNERINSIGIYFKPRMIPRIKDLSDVTPKIEDKDNQQSDTNPVASDDN